MLIALSGFGWFSRLDLEPLFVHISTIYWSIETNKVCTLCSYIRGRRMRSMKWWLHHHGGRRLGEEAEIMVDVSVLAFAKVSFNIQRGLSTVELCRLCWSLPSVNSQIHKSKSKQSQQRKKGYENCPEAWGLVIDIVHGCIIVRIGVRLSCSFSSLARFHLLVQEVNQKIPIKVLGYQSSLTSVQLGYQSSLPSVHIFSLYI